MNEKLFITFAILNIVNVIIQTVKSLATVKCGKVVASIVNAIAYGLYTVVVVYTVCDLPLWLKVLVVSVANLIGVFVVKLIEEKSKKDKLWKIEATLKNQNLGNNDDCIIELKESQIPFNYIDIDRYLIVNCFCATQKESIKAKQILDKYQAKYFVTESKIL